MKFKKVEEGIVPIYENETKERLINARELHEKLENKRKFSDWIKQRIMQYDFTENQEYIKNHNFVTVGNLKRPQIDYYITIDMAKELYYEIQYIRNTKKGKKGEIKERGYKIEEICYKVI